MNVEEMARKKREVVEKHGEWTAHNIHLGGDLYTIDGRIIADELKLRQVVQTVADAARRPLNELRILDLACLEGLYGIELARHGASVVLVEGREANLEKARYAKEVLGLENVELHLDDVRNLSPEKYGHFDVVLCLGILYHLDQPDVFRFLEQISAVCTGITIISTQYSLVAEVSVEYKGHTYWGRKTREHSPDSSMEERMEKVWNSLDNPHSFEFTRSSLLNFLSNYGYTSAYACLTPATGVGFPDKIERCGNLPSASEESAGKGSGPGALSWIVNKTHGPRIEETITLLAVKGKPAEIISAPLLEDRGQLEWPEFAGPSQGGDSSGGLRSLGGALPQPVKNGVKKLLGI